MHTGHIYVEKNVKGINILKIKGHFTKDTVPEMQKICYGAGKENDVKGVLLDFAEVASIDTSAFACMIKFIKDHMEHGIGIGVVNFRSKERMLAEVLKIDSAIRAFESEEEAVRELSGNG